jgi:DNA gyrase subunit B
MSEENTSAVLNSPDAPPGEQVPGPAESLATTPTLEYDRDAVEIYKDTAHIRQRPGMYIGDTGENGLHHLVYELVYNSVDEALAGHCQNIIVKINLDGSLSVSDDGRGIPVEEHPVAKRSTLEVVMTTVGAGAKFGKGAYRVSAGLHGIGAKAVTALSEWVEAEVRRNGKVYFQEYERGRPITEVKERGIATHTGTRITFNPDPELFKDASFQYDTLQRRLRELAFLNKGLGITLIDEAKNKEERFWFEGGIGAYVKYLNDKSERVPQHDKVLYVDRMVEEVRVEVAMQYTQSDDAIVYCYANNAHNPEGGTHLTGFRNALTRTILDYGKKQNLFKNDIEPRGEDCLEGLTAIVSIQVPDPQFTAQMKVKLTNPEVATAVNAVLADYLSKYLEENPKESVKIIKKVQLAAEARLAAQKARQSLKDRKSILNGGGLPGKLYDCTDRDREKSELFLVEGDSAGGSAEQGRDRRFQAILPLRGKPLNVEKARLENMLKNEEITSLISAIGIDIGDTTSEEELEKRLRYGKVIVMTDADVDGQHIRTLLLTFFYRQMPRLVIDGHVYVARPPLYKVTEKKNAHFVQSVDEMEQELISRGLKGTKLAIHPPPVEGAPEQAPRRLEGGELEALLRLLIRLEKGVSTLEKRGINLASFLTRWGERGLPVYRVVVGGHERWCNTRDEVEAIRQQEQQRLGRELVAGEEAPPPAADGSAVPETPAVRLADTFYEQELHEVRDVNRGIQELNRFGLLPTDLVPQPRVAGREPPVRLRLEYAGDQSRLVVHLRDLVSDIRRLGEKGLSITRFKGLGEMDPEELWATTLDPEHRTLMRVQLDDALEADEMFRTLMGEKVEPRRDFIVKYALDVKQEDLDFGA